MSHTLRPDALRAVWVSDVHLGSRACRAALLLDFLKRTHCDVLYLVGDIIDLESLRQEFYWPQGHTDVLTAIVEKSRAGTRVVYIPGNHDHELRELAGTQVGNIEVALQEIHTTAAGRRLLVVHGDCFDAIVRGHGFRVRVGAHACRTLLQLNRFVHWLHDLVGKPYWSLAQHVKSSFGFVQRYLDRYRDATLDAARSAGVDGVVCGHIHKAEMTEVDGLMYFNDGDWVESCTALVENRSGELSLIHWRPSPVEIGASLPLPIDVARGAPLSSERRPAMARPRRHMAPVDWLRTRRGRRAEAQRAGSRVEPPSA